MAARSYLAHFVAGSESAAAIDAFLTDELPLVKGSLGLFVYQLAGLTGQLRSTEDANGLLVYAFHSRESARTARRLSFRRAKSKYPTAPRALFFPAPLVYAHLRGETTLRLSAADMRKWGRALLAAVGLDAGLAFERTRQALEGSVFQRYPLPWTPAILAGGDGIEERTAFRVVLGARFGRVRHLNVFLVWTHFVERWAESASRSRTGLPCPAAASDGYLGQRLHLSRKTARRARVDLERMGYVAPARHVADKCGRRGYFAYLPGTGLPPTRPRPKPFRERDALAAMRAYLASARERTKTRAGHTKLLEQESCEMK